MYQESNIYFVQSILKVQRFESGALTYVHSERPRSNKGAPNYLLALHLMIKQNHIMN